MQLTSPVFSNGNPIPEKFTCEGENFNPPLLILGTPLDSRSICLTVEDPDSPSGNFVHWILYDVKPTINTIRENWIPEAALQGRNDFGNHNYGGPCPITGNHRYIFTIYALDKSLNEPVENISKLHSLTAGHILAEASLTGTYQKKNI
jgi:Raf kinase inhibitor-like YbhB/YbcL family protein